MSYLGTQDLKVHLPSQEYNITFTGGGDKETGKLVWDENEFKFEGNADSCAKVFFKEVIKNYSTYHKDMINENLALKREIKKLMFIKDRIIEG